MGAHWICFLVQGASGAKMWRRSSQDTITPALPTDAIVAFYHQRLSIRTGPQLGGAAGRTLLHNSLPGGLHTQKSDASIASHSQIPAQGVHSYSLVPGRSSDPLCHGPQRPSTLLKS